MKSLLLLSLMFFLMNGYACVVTNITGDNEKAIRQQVFNSKYEGVRIAYSGIKEANAAFGLGAVNTAMESFEKDLCEKLPQGTKVYKTDFKGYFIRCAEQCSNTVSKLDEVMAPSLENSEQKLNFTKVRANSFREGYVKARVMSEYGDTGDELISFINKELSESIDGLDIKSDEFKLSLSKSIELYRKGKVDQIDKKHLRLIKSLDVLLEVPYSNSNNIDQELETAMNKNSKITSAQTGDDLFIIIKEGDQVSKVIGADAKGLGVLNIMSRLESLSDNQEAFQSIDDVYDLSINSIKDADLIMDQSMKTYESIMKEEILNYPARDMELSIGIAHRKYEQMAAENQSLMSMRAGALTNCGKDPKVVMNQITAIHNRLKTLESSGITGYFGNSCLGAQYWLLKNGL